MTIQLYPFQEQGVRKIERRNGRVILSDEMGLGKTVQAIEYFKRNDIGPVVIVTPASLKWHWENQVARQTGITSDVLSGMSPRKVGLANNKVTIVNYDILHAWLPYLQKINPQMVIFDEAHYLRTTTSRRFKAAKELVRDVDKLLLLTGSPIVNRPIDLYPLLHLLHPRKFKSLRRFGFRFCNPRRQFGKWVFRGARNHEQLHKTLKKYGMIRRLKKNVLDQLPPEQSSMVPLTLSKKSMREYEHAQLTASKWLKNNYKPGQNDKRMEAFTMIGELKQLAASLKLELVYEWIDNWLESSKEKLIVFGHHHKIIATLVERYKDMCAVVTGKTPGPQRRERFEAFNASKKCRLFFGNLVAAGTGWSARACSNVAKIEIDWLPGNHTQASARTHGVGRGQEGKVSMTHWLVAKGTIEETLCKMVQDKQADIDRIVDGKKLGALNLFDQLVEVLRGM